MDVAVTDLATGGSTVMSGALTYANIAPDTMALVSAPSGTVAVGTPAAAPFAVRMFQGDGVTPVAGLPVTFSVDSGSAQFSVVRQFDLRGADRHDRAGGDGGDANCVRHRHAAGDGSGRGADRNVPGIARGIPQWCPWSISRRMQSLAWTPQVSVVQNGAAAAGVAVAWTAAGAMTISPAEGVNEFAGYGSGRRGTAGPLAGRRAGNCPGLRVDSSCARGSPLSRVDPSAWRLAVVGGAGQSVPPTSITFAPVVLMVTDASGNPVAGAAVTIHQTVDAAEMPCPARGRCPVAPVLAASQAAAISDADGLVSVTPMQIAGTAGVTNIAVAAGTQGFVRSRAPAAALTGRPAPQSVPRPPGWLRTLYLG